VRQLVPRARLLPTGWPLTALYGLFPLWWLLGVSHFIFILLAVPMAAELVKRRPIYVPRGFGLWLLFLVWVAAGIFVLWSVAPGTAAEGSLARLIPFTYRGLWYIAITVVLLYVINLSERELPTQKILRLLSRMFVLCVVGGLAGLLIPTVSFPSVLELFVHVGDSGFMFSLIHPSLAAESDFLGYAQARPTAPFAYANAWGNNTGMYLPFFVLTWFGPDAGWRRRAAPFVLALAVIPLTMSLNRGLWAGLALAVILFAIRLALSGRVMMLGSILIVVGLAGSLFFVSPLYDTVTLRIETPHSNERRGTVAEEVIGKTWEGSPLLGYGSTRTVQGSFASIAGGETESCHQCAAPPLGTQGFLWRLIFTTGLVGTVLYLGFLVVQLLRYIRYHDPLSVVCCIVIMMSLLFFMVYDSLESPLYTLMIAIALLNRRALADVEQRWKDPADSVAAP
jgi:hypothetical protein